MKVIEQQEIRASELGAKLPCLASSDCLHKVVCELLHADAKDIEAMAGGSMADGMEEVGLAQTHATLYYQRVIGVTRVLSDSLRGGVGELVTSAMYEVLKGVLGVDLWMGVCLRPMGVAWSAGLLVGRGILGMRGRNVKLNFDVLPENAHKRLFDQRAEALFQPLCGEGSRNTDDKLSFAVTEANGTLKPGAVIGFADLKL
jgi:hypothetical protein